MNNDTLNTSTARKKIHNNDRIMHWSQLWHTKIEHQSATVYIDVYSTKKYDESHTKKIYMYI